MMQHNQATLDHALQLITLTTTLCNPMIKWYSKAFSAIASTTSTLLHHIKHKGKHVFMQVQVS